MAIVFSTVDRIILLDSLTVSASEIWSRWVDWVALSDNSIHPPAFSQLGGVAPVALYLYLENGWLVRPMEQDGITTISGNLLVQGGGSPIAQTTGNFNVLVNLETPVQAQAIEVDSGSGLTPSESSQLDQIHASEWNRRTRNPLTGRETIYEDDKVTVMKEFDTTDNGTQITEITPL